MKKAISILLAIIIAMASVSAFAETTEIAENFSIRNGITFGMKADEVLAIENDAGNTPLRDEAINKEYERTKYRTISFTEIDVAGIPNSSLDYYFSADDSIVGVSYEFGDIFYQVNPVDVYNQMKEILIQKYGNPVKDDGHPISDEMITHRLMVKKLYQNGQRQGGHSYYIENLCQWIVKYEDCYVLIDMFISGEKIFFCNIAYQLYTHDEFEILLQQQADIASEKSAKINSDL